MAPGAHTCAGVEESASAGAAAPRSRPPVSRPAASAAFGPVKRNIRMESIPSRQIVRNFLVHLGPGSLRLPPGAVTNSARGSSPPHVFVSLATSHAAWIPHYEE